MHDDPKRDELERRHSDAHRRFELAIAEANQAPLGSKEYREAMAVVRAAARELEELEAEEPR